MGCYYKYRLNDNNFCYVACAYCTLEQETACKRKQQKKEEAETNLCKDCVHCEICKHLSTLPLFDENQEALCKAYKPKSRFVELPCEVGQTVYLLMGGFVEEMKLSHLFMSFKPNEQHPIDFVKEFEDFGKTVFLSREEAENALKEREKE